MKRIIAVLFSAFVSACGGGGGVDGQQPSTVQVTNNPPTPRATIDAVQIILGELVNVNGYLSSDAEGDPISYHWELIEKPVESAASIGSNSALVSYSFRPDVVGRYSLSLRVTDSLGLSSSVNGAQSIVSFLVNPLPVTPVARVQIARPILPGDMATVTSIGSVDPNGDPLTFKWTINSAPFGSVARFFNDSVADAKFHADWPGRYSVSLVVTDPAGNASTPVTASIDVSCYTSGTTPDFVFSNLNKVTGDFQITNTSASEDYIIWALTTHLVTGSLPSIVDVSQFVGKGQTINVKMNWSSGLPYSSYPEIIFTKRSGGTCAYDPNYPLAHTWPVFLMDRTDSVRSAFPEGELISLFNPLQEAAFFIRGYCQDFSWIDVSKFSYQIAPTSIAGQSYCFRGNMMGYDASGNAVVVPNFIYFVTDKSKVAFP